MVNEQLVPHLTTGGSSFQEFALLLGLGKASWLRFLADIIEEQSDPTVAPYAKTGEVTLRLSTKGERSGRSGC